MTSVIETVVWNGTDWTAADILTWNGTDWVAPSVNPQTWDGSTWVPVGVPPVGGEPGSVPPFQGARSATYNSGTSFTEALPANTVAGDVVVGIWMSNLAVDSYSLPTGWNVLYRGALAGSSYLVAWHRVDSLESQFTWSRGSTESTGKVTAAFASYYGVKDVAAQIQIETAAVGTHVSPAITTTGPNQRIVRLWADKSTGATSVTLSSEVTQRDICYAIDTTVIADEPAATAGTYGPVTATYNVANKNAIGVAVALVPVDVSGPTAPPQAPTGLVTTDITINAVALGWDPADTATTYYLYQDGAKTQETAETTATVTGLSPSTTYAFTVSAVNAKGEGAQSDPLSVTTEAEPPPPTIAPATFFAPASPINTRDAASASVNSLSAAMVTAMLRTKPPLLDVGIGPTFGGVPVYLATSSTPRFTVIPAYTHGSPGSPLSYWSRDDWGTNPFQGRTIPWDSTWPTPGDPTKRSDDKWAVVVDTDGTVYELWMTTWNYNGDGKLECWWGCMSDANTTNGGVKPTSGRGVGANLSRLAGLITLEDWQRGYINHALTFSGDYAKGPKDSANYVYPASATDGTLTDTTYTWMPEGQWIRIKSSYSIPTTLPIWLQMVVKALQDYGGYLVDVAGQGTTFSCARYPVTGDVASVFASVGLPTASSSNEWMDMSAVPWASVLECIDHPTPSPLYY